MNIDGQAQIHFSAINSHESTAIRELSQHASTRLSPELLSSTEHFTSLLYPHAFLEYTLNEPLTQDTKRGAKRRYRKNLSEEQKLKRRSADADRKRFIRENESEKQRVKRRATNAKRQRQRRERESERIKLEGCETDVGSVQRHQRNEFEEELAKRRRANAERNRWRRANESEEERTRRRRANAERNRYRRENESIEERTRRCRVNAERSRVRRENESEEERKKRRIIDVERNRRRRKNESEEEGFRRRIANAERNRRRRLNNTGKVKFKQCADYCNTNQIFFCDKCGEQLSDDVNFLHNINMHICQSTGVVSTIDEYNETPSSIKITNNLNDNISIKMYKRKEFERGEIKIEVDELSFYAQIKKEFEEDEVKTDFEQYSRDLPNIKTSNMDVELQNNSQDNILTDTVKNKLEKCYDFQSKQTQIKESPFCIQIKKELDMDDVKLEFER